MALLFNFWGNPNSKSAAISDINLKCVVDMWRIGRLRRVDLKDVNENFENYV